MRCAKCKTENPDGLKFCNECGAPFKTPCASCGFENAPAAKFCGQCGAALGAPAAAASAKKSDRTQIRLTDPLAPENLEGERKTVSVLFADIKGSMDLIEDLDPEEARTIVDPALKLMMEAVQRYGGYVAQSTGDGIFALFGAPAAHEDHPQRALHAALRMQDELKCYSDRIRSEGHLRVQVRVGVNTGEVVVRSVQKDEARTEYVPIGHAASLAARMQALAPVGSIAATEAVRRLCEGYFTFKSLGPTKVKGVGEPVEVYEVTGIGPLHNQLQRSASRGLSRFVGRDTEISQMKRALTSAKSGSGQVVAAVGEPGVGKSRLFHEFQAIGHSDFLVLTAQSVSHGKTSSYLPLIELLKNYFQISAEDDSHKRREKIGGKVLMLDRALEDILPYLFTLLEVAGSDDLLAQMAPDARRRRTLVAIKRLLLRESVNQPLIVVFEDLHWLDEGSQAFLDLLVESIGTARVLLLVNYRPEYTHRWANKTYYTQLRLDPLGAENAEVFLNALLGDGPDLTPLKRIIVDKTEGNPFFMEEIVQALFEQEALLRDNAVKLTKSLSSIQIPATVQAVLASRIDRLPPEGKDLLNTLAVIGKEFPLELVRRTTGKSADELERMLGDLQAAEFIYEQPSFTNLAYVFKHALSQQVAYGSALLERRKVLHERIARVLEAHFSETAETQPELIAHHYTEAGLGGEAIPFWQSAGARAIQRGANAEAIKHLTLGLELLKSLMGNPKRTSQREADESRHCSILLLLADAQRNLGEHLEAHGRWVHAAEIAQALSSVALLVRAASELAMSASWFGTPAEPAVRFLQTALKTAGADDQVLKIKVLAGLGRALAAIGSHQKAREAVLEAVALARSLNDSELLTEGLQAALDAFQGPEYTEQRLAYASEVMRHVRAKEMLSHNLAITGTRWYLFTAYLELGDIPAFDAELDAWLRYQEKWQEPFLVSPGLQYQAMRALMQGRFTDSERLATQASVLDNQTQQDTSGVFAMQMFTLRREQGRLKELEPVVRHFVQQKTVAASWRPGLALIYAELGLEGEAREQFEHLAQHDFNGIPRDGLWMASMAYLVDVCTFLRDRPRAAILYQLLVPYNGRNVVIGSASACYGALSRYLGALATTLGRWHEAEQHFEDAIAMNARMGARPWLAHTQCQYATMLLLARRSGDHDRAGELFHSALLTARELGMTALEERLNERMRSMSRDGH